MTNIQTGVTHGTTITTLDGLPAEAERAMATVTPTHVIKEPSHKLTHLQVQRMKKKTGMMISHRLKLHTRHTKQSQECQDQADDKAPTTDPYQSTPGTQPGSYPWEGSTPSKTPTYAEMQDSLVTQESEDRLLQSRAGMTGLSGATSSEYHKLPPPPAPKVSEPGYGQYMIEQQREEWKYCEEQSKKCVEWEQPNNQYRGAKCGFATDEPHPSNDILHWLCWNDRSTTSYPKWAQELQSVCPIEYKELAR